MPKINVLDRQTAELIAAGEVVERPASAIKELVENSIDAGATAITVEIEGGGVVLMRITDNGCGIAREDVPRAFLRHATSKIATERDLDSIGTLGFRGEALAAIASVSRIDLMTKTPGAISGTSLQLEAGQITDETEIGCPEGTTIIVRDLFYNTPARMKFMKSDTVEGGRVAASVVPNVDVGILLAAGALPEQRHAGGGQLRFRLGRRGHIDLIGFSLGKVGMGQDQTAEGPGICCL